MGGKDFLKQEGMYPPLKFLGTEEGGGGGSTDGAGTRPWRVGL